MLRFTYPNGKYSALTFSYDDGQIYDRRLVEIFDRYGMRATFHLNSGWLDTIGKEKEPSGEYTEFVKSAEVKELYKNHEIAAHGFYHPFMDQLCEGELVSEILDDRRYLEKISGRIVTGMSYPFGNYNDKIIQTARTLGIEYSRTVEDTMSFNLPRDFMAWHPTCHHSRLNDAMIEEFINPPAYRTLPLFYIWGHSFEFGRENKWEFIEDVCKRLSGLSHVWYATNGQIKDYITAVRSVKTSADTDIAINPSGQTVYYMSGDEVKSIAPNETVRILPDDPKKREWP